MHKDTGEILPLKELEEMKQQERAYFQENKDKLMKMMLPPTAKQMKRKPPRVDFNEPCPCGSGKKFKVCCFTGGV